ncbi:MAG: formate dehydrogenase accessory protein FdhE [Burkholderiales bacterium]|nr:formate dehydrogenase accessory protein FdhE [Burkholderiales bacterium]
MDKTTRLNAIEDYKKKKDGFDWSGLMEYAGNVLSSRDEISTGIETPPFSKEKAEEALKEGVPYLKLEPVLIDPAQFRKKCEELEQLYIDKGLFHGAEQLQAVKKFDWDKLTDKTIGKAGVSPNDFFLDASKELCAEDEKISTILLAGLLVNVVRAYLNGTGEEMTEFLAHRDPVRTSNQPMKCPTCNEPATLGAVLEGVENSGNAKRLYCVCCGTVWPFERIRCAHCGNRNSSKLKYIHTEQDTAHRLYVCEECGGYTPTVFQDTLGAALDYDIEQTALSVLESIYLQDQADKEAKAKEGHSDTEAGTEDKEKADKAIQ